MYVNAALSCLGGWQNLQQVHPSALEDIQRALAQVEVEKLRRRDRIRTPSGPSAVVSPRDLATALTQQLGDLGWRQSNRDTQQSEIPKRPLSIDGVKDGVGIEISLGKSVFLQSKIFLDFPYLINAKMFQLAVALLPTRSFARTMMPAVGVGTFESIKDTLTEVSPLPLKYPLAVLGYSHEKSAVEITELTSELDIFLLQSVGLSLNEMVLLNERPNYDFKQQLPDAKKVAQEICAFANNQGGGLILLGVDKHGIAVGIPQGKSLDDVQLQVTNTIRDTCVPQPSFEFHAFHVTGEAGTGALLVIRVHELDRKPCMVRDAVYIRSGPSARPAGPDDIRRLVLGQSY